MIVLTAATGYYLAIHEHFEMYLSSLSHVLLFFTAMIGTALTSAGSCVLNNYVEKEHDQNMKRTSKRALPSGIIHPRSALIFGITLSIIGFALLFVFVNVLTAVLSLVTIIAYVNIYTPLKRRSKVSLYAGTLPGAIPALGGWTAVTNSIDIPGLLLFGILLVWQIPHFLALAWIYRIDYRQAGFIMHTYEGDSTALHISRLSIAYMLIGMLLSMALWLYAPLGFVYLIGVIALSLFFLYACLTFYKHQDGKSAKLQLYASYAYLTGIFLLVFVNKQL